MNDKYIYIVLDKYDEFEFPMYLGSLWELSKELKINFNTIYKCFLRKTVLEGKYVIKRVLENEHTVLTDKYFNLVKDLLKVKEFYKSLSDFDNKEFNKLLLWFSMKQLLSKSKAV